MKSYFALCLLLSLVGVRSRDLLQGDRLNSASESISDLESESIPELAPESIPELEPESISTLPADMAKLTEETPLEGHLEKDFMQFGISVQAVKGKFPDILLSSSVINQGADAQLFCQPFASENWEPKWVSGGKSKDYAFISSKSPYYDFAVTDEENGVAEFECRLARTSYLHPSYFVQLDLSYDTRKMAESEYNAMESIYKKCCSTVDSCFTWKELYHSVELEEKNATREVTSFDFCHLESNICDEDGHIIKLDMGALGLQCDFPVDEIKSLKKLEKLFMSFNQMTGNIEEIFAALRGLEKLEEVFLTGNRLGGRLDAVVNSSVPLCDLVEKSVRYVHISTNLIGGQIPSCLFKNGSLLRDFVADQNPITGQFPNSISESSNLEYLSLSTTGLNGTFPEGLSKLKHLLHLDLSGNELTGQLPDGFQLASKLRFLSLRGNYFTGKIPDGIATSTSLETVFLSSNQFTAIPAYWKDKQPTGQISLTSLDLSYNQIEDTFPEELSLLESLSIVRLNENKFYGELPKIIDLFPNGWVVDLSSNAFTGPLPKQWITLGLFQGTAEEQGYIAPSINLTSNLFEGEIDPVFLDPDNFPRGQLNSIYLDLGDNNFVCPEEHSVSHLGGFEECSETTIGETIFDIQSHSGDGNSLSGGLSDVDLTSSSEDRSTSSDSHASTYIVVIAILGSALFGTVFLAIAMLIKRRSSIRRAKKFDDPEMSHANMEAVPSSSDLEQSGLRAGLDNSAAPL